MAKASHSRKPSHIAPGQPVTAWRRARGSQLAGRATSNSSEKPTAPRVPSRSTKRRKPTTTRITAKPRIASKVSGMAARARPVRARYPPWFGMGGEGLCELCRLPLCDCRVTGPGRRRDRRTGVPLRMTGFGILGRLEGGEMGGAHGIVGPALDLGPALGGERALAGREHRGQAVERVALQAPQTGPCQARREGAEAVADRDRARQFRLLEPGPHPGQYRRIIVRCCGCGAVEPGHRIGRGGAGIERVDDGERGRLVGRVRGAGQGVARGVDRGGVLVPFGQQPLCPRRSARRCRNRCRTAPNH